MNASRSSLSDPLRFIVHIICARMLTPSTIAASITWPLPDRSRS